MAAKIRSRFRPEIPECHSAGLVPKRAANRSRNWAVSAISGTRISACLPSLSAAATASKYTSVLPEPVTPSRSVTENAPLVTVSASFAEASFWSASNVVTAKSASGCSTIAFIGISSVVSVPSSINPSITEVLTPASCASARLPNSKPPSAAATARARAGVSRFGRAPVNRTPICAASSCSSSGPRNAMRNTAPRGASV